MGTGVAVAREAGPSPQPTPNKLMATTASAADNLNLNSSVNNIGRPFFDTGSQICADRRLAGTPYGPKLGSPAHRNATIPAARRDSRGHPTWILGRSWTAGLSRVCGLGRLGRERFPVRLLMLRQGLRVAL